MNQARSLEGRDNPHHGLWAAVWGALAIFSACLAVWQDPIWVVATCCYAWMCGVKCEAAYPPNLKRLR